MTASGILAEDRPNTSRRRGRAPRRSVRGALTRQRARYAKAYVTPLALLVGALFVVPLGLMLWMSFNDWPLLGTSKPNGVANYKTLSQPLFTQAVWFTVKYTVLTTVVLGVVSLGLALLMQERRPGIGIFRTAFFLPAAVGIASASLLFYSLFVTDDSPLNVAARWLGLTHNDVNWLGSNSHALMSVLGMVVWRFAGFYMLILMTGLQSIDPALYEAARIDGGGRWQIFWRVTLPLLRPTIALTLILSITGSLLAFDQFFILTGGRQQTATAVIAVYRQAFIQQDLGGAAAMSVAILVVLLIINGLQLLILRRGDR